MLIVGITGKAGSGKDTIADFLVAKRQFKKDCLAAPIKRLVKDIFSLSDEEINDRALRELPMRNWDGWTTRKLLQYIGTEMFRAAIGPDVWVKSLCLRLFNSEYQRWVIPDVRFPNEGEVLRSVFGNNFTLIKVERPGYDGAPSGIKGHASEAYDLAADHVLVNDGSVGTLLSRLDAIVALDEILR